MTVMDEIGHLIRSKPGPDASPVQLADWYEQKAHMLEQVAAEGQANRHLSLRQAGAAHRRAAALLAKCA